MRPLRIGTRGSRLALWQANFVADLLLPLAAPRPIEIVEVHGIDRFEAQRFHPQIHCPLDPVVVDRRDDAIASGG